MADRFQTLYLRGLVKLHQEHQLKLAGQLAPLAERSAFDEWLAPLARKDWIVNVQSPPAHCAEPDAALKYLASYVAGSAIGNQRIVRDDGRRVTFRVKEYRHGGKQVTARIAGSEFVRRFLLHILPPRFRRVRYFGLLAGSDNRKNLALCQKLLGVEAAAETPAASPGASDLWRCRTLEILKLLSRTIRSRQLVPTVGLRRWSGWPICGRWKLGGSGD